MVICNIDFLAYELLVTIFWVVVKFMYIKFGFYKILVFLFLFSYFKICDRKYKVIWHASWIFATDFSNSNLAFCNRFFSLKFATDSTNDQINHLRWLLKIGSKILFATEKIGHKWICNLPICDQQNQSQIIFATDFLHFATKKSVATRQFSSCEFSQFHHVAWFG